MDRIRCLLFVLTIAVGSAALAAQSTPRSEDTVSDPIDATQAAATAYEQCIRLWKDKVADDQIEAVSGDGEAEILAACEGARTDVAALLPADYRETVLAEMDKRTGNFIRE